LACFKTAIAYVRDLDFKQVSFEKASTIFGKIRMGKPCEDIRPLHDYLLHMQLRWADTYGLPMQIHTGYLAGNWQDIRQGDPSKLIPLFIEYPNVRFDLFHASWPYSEFMAAVAKQFPNVSLDMCWAWAMAPVQMERTLDEWLSSVPNNKIIGFGGDAISPFASIGYAVQARMGIANCLERKIKRGEYSQATAEMVARKIMWQNGLEIFPTFKTKMNREIK
jgi:predicted TIM-barrel fold metal-dependent hydrolase